MEETAARIRPRDLDRIIGDSFQIYIRHFIKCAGAAALTMTPLIVISALLWAAGEFATVHADGWPDLPRFLVTEWLFPVGTVILFVLLYPLLQGALIHVTTQHQLGQQVSIGQAFGFAWKRMGDLGGALLLCAVLLAAMMVSAIGLPFAIYHEITWLFVLSAIAAVGFPLAIYFGIKWLFASQAVMVERLGPVTGLSRSADLATGHWWRIFGIRIVIILIQAGCWIGAGILVGVPFLIYSLASDDFYTPWGGSPETTVLVVQAIVAAAVVIPLSIIADTLLYYDLRVRKEDYTLARLGTEFGSGSGEAVRPIEPSVIRQEIERPQRLRRTSPKLPLVGLALAVALLAVVLTPIVRNQVGADRVQVSIRRLSDGKQTALYHDGRLNQVAYTDFDFVVDFNRPVEATGQDNVIEAGVPWLESGVRLIVMPRLYACEGTIESAREYLATPERDPANELSATVTLLSRERIVVSPVAGSFPAGSQVVLYLESGSGSVGGARIFT